MLQNFETMPIYGEISLIKFVSKFIKNSCEVSSQKLVHLTNLVTIFKFVLE